MILRKLTRRLDADTGATRSARPTRTREVVVVVVEVLV